MGQIEKTVFISYRRTNLPWALNIYQNLTAHGYDVFFDYENINSGDFEQIILENIRSRAHFIVILTPSMLERIDEPNDWVRFEIETALEEKRNIVSLFFEGFNFSDPYISGKLTGKLELLRKYAGFDVPASYFNEAMDRLRNRYLNVSLDIVKHPVSPTVQRASQKQQVAASKAEPVKEKELTAQEWFEKGYQSVDLDEKISCYTESIRLKPDYASAYYNRGNARYNKGDLDGAIKDYNEAIRLKPDYVIVYYNRANTWKQKAAYRAAMNDYQKYLDLGGGIRDGDQEKVEGFIRDLKKKVK